MAQLTSTTVTGNLAVTGTVVANEILNNEGNSVTLPSYSGTNNNQFLRVIDGKVVWSAVPNAEDSAF